MNGCIYRTEENKCKQFSVGGVLSFCYLDGTCDCQISSNADRIRAMSDEELAEWMAINTDCFFCKVKNKNICSLDEGTCTEEWLSWLKAPVEEVHDER